jgi:hypothetical protein
MSYPSNSAVSRDWFLNPLLMNVQDSSSSAPSGLVKISHIFDSLVPPSTKVSAEDDSLKFIADHLSEFLDEFENTWVIVRHRQILAHASTLPDLLRIAADSGIKKPFVLKIERPPTKMWRTAFGYSR